MNKSKVKLTYASPNLLDSDGNIKPELETVLGIINPREEASDGKKKVTNNEK